MDGRRRAVIIVFVLAGLLLVTYGVYLYQNYDTRGYDHLAHLTEQDLKRLKGCAPEETDVLHQTMSGYGLTCARMNPRKHSITLLSSFSPNDISFVRNLYEATAQLNVYSPYYETDDQHVQACTFQTGPWELFCRGSPECHYQNPPPWEVPYLVKTLHPTRHRECGKFGYPLPTHDAVISIVRNPIDALHGWQENSGSTNVSEVLVGYREWHAFWKFYEGQYPRIPMTWIRAEDLCLCPRQGLLTVLRANGFDNIDETALETALKSFPCDLEGGIGSGLASLTPEDFHTIQSELAEYVEHFGYSLLMQEMANQTASERTTEQVSSLLAALYSEDFQAPDEQECSLLLFRRWSWSIPLG